MVRKRCLLAQKAFSEERVEGLGDGDASDRFGNKRQRNWQRRVSDFQSREVSPVGSQQQFPMVVRWEENPLTVINWMI